jgi:hypothetical protein
MPTTRIKIRKQGKFDFEGKTRLARQRATTGMRQMLEDIHKTSRPITPKLTGDLRGDVRKEVTKKGADTIRGTIEWQRPYAWYQERGYTSGPIRNYTTPGTGAHFAERSVKEVTGGNTRKYFGKKI